jgi:hypothetical protein
MISISFSTTDSCCQFYYLLPLSVFVFREIFSEGSRITDCEAKGDFS